MKTINRSTIKGRLGPRISFHPLPSGDFALRISIATDHVFHRRGSVERHTEWHEVKTYVPKDKETVFRRHLYKGAWVQIEGPVITDVVEKEGRREFYKFLRPFAEDIDFLSLPQEVAAEESMPADADDYAPVAFRSDANPLDAPLPEPIVTTPPAPLASPAPTPRAYEPRQRGRLWDNDAPTPPSSRPPRKNGSVKDLLEQD